MSQMLLLCGEDNAPSLMVDMVTKEVTRYSKGMLFTDDVGYVYAKSNEDYIWAHDRNSNIVCWTKDLVDIAKLDIGYWAASHRDTGTLRWNCFHIDSNFLYVLSTRRHDGGTYDYNAVDEYQLTIRKFDKVTLAFDSEVVLSDPLLWDNDLKLNTAYLDSYFWTGTFLWIRGQTGDWYKVNITSGAIVDTWVGGPSWNPVWSNADASKVIPDLAWWDTSYEVANFATKTTSSVSMNFATSGVAAGKFPSEDTGIFAQNILSDVSYTPKVDESTTTIHFVVHSTLSGGWPHERYFMVAFNWATGDVTFSNGIEMNILVPDAEKLPKGMIIDENINTIDYYVVVNATKAVVWYRAVAAILDFQAGTTEVFKVESMQSYSGRGIYMRPGRLIDIPSATITGTVTVNGAAGSNQKVFLYDQATGQKMEEATTGSDGSYEFIKYTNRPYFVVCAAPNANANYKIKSKL